MRKTEYPVADCDGHVAEPFSLYADYCEPEYRDRMPKRVERDGKKRVIVDGKEHADFVRYGGRPLGMENDAKIPRPVQHSAISEGGVNPAVRLADMEKEQLDVAILYPSGATSMCAIEDADLESAAYRAYNRWLAEYCSADTTRLKGNVLVSIRHPEHGVQEILRNADEPWLAGILIPTHIDDYNLDHPRFDPIYAVAQDLDLPICFHAGAGRPPYAMGTNESSSNLFLMHSFAHPLEQMRAMASLIGGGVFDRFPRLRTGYIECGIGWVAWWLDRLKEHQQNLPTHVPHMKREPLQYLHDGHCFINLALDEISVEAVISLVGDDCVIFGSDYPHWDCGYDGVINKVKRRDLSATSLRKIFWDNALRLHPRIADTASLIKTQATEVA